MVRKAGLMGVPVVVSYSTPSMAAYEAAMPANITLIGYRNQNVLVYCGSERVVDCELENAEYGDQNDSCAMIPGVYAVSMSEED